MQKRKKERNYSFVNLGVFKFLDRRHELERCWTDWQQCGSL